MPIWRYMAMASGQQLAGLVAVAGAVTVDEHAGVFSIYRLRTLTTRSVPRVAPEAAGVETLPLDTLGRESVT